MSEVFISYAREEAAQAVQVEAALRGLGYTVWRDDQIPAHRSYTDVLEERLKASKAVLVLWSAEATRSQWVRAEAEVAREAGTLVQARIGDVSPPLPFNQIQCADLIAWSGDPDAAGWRKIVDSVADLVGRTPGSPGPPPSRNQEPGEGKRRKPDLSARMTAVIVTLVALVALLAAGGWWLRSQPSPADAADVRVAVLPFDVTDANPAARAFADALRTGLVSALTSDEVQTLSASDSAGLRGSSSAAEVKRLRVALVLGGLVRSDGESLRVHVSLDDPRAHITLWSKDFQGLAANPDIFEAVVVQRVAAVAGIGASPGLQRLDRRAASAFLEASFQMADGSSQRAVELLRDVVAGAPDFAQGHAQLAFAVRDVAKQSPPDVQAAAITEARREAERALALDPRQGPPYSVLANATPVRAWAERERLFAKGLAVDSHSVSLARHYGRLLGQVGRSRDAVAELRQAASIEQFEARAHAELALALSIVGRGKEGAAILQEAERLWPGDMGLRQARFIFLMNTSSFAQALTLLDDSGLSSGFPPETIAAFRAHIAAMQSGDATQKRRTTAVVSEAAKNRALLPAHAMLLLCGLGDIDGAFREGERAASPAELQRPYIYSGLELTPLFLPSGEPMRRDPRFIRLAAKFGLVDYWRSTGHWPDFCSEPGLPYDCKAEAARLAQS